MLSIEENELLTRVGPGTLMGDLMRQYWMPVLLSTELEPGGRVKRVKLLGEDLVAFRSRTGLQRAWHATPWARPGFVSDSSRLSSAAPRHEVDRRG
jgi:hypothetical protein